MKLKNNIVIGSEIEITFNSFNPTAGRLAACLLGFSIQVQIRTPTEPRSHTGAHSHGHHTGSAAQQRPGAGGLQGGRARPRPRERRAASGERRAGSPRSPGRNCGSAERQVARSTAEAEASRWLDYTVFSSLVYLGYNLHHVSSKYS